MQTKEIKTIETYSLYEFCKAVQEAVQEGYVFDFDSNDLFPQAFGSLMTAGMVKYNEVEVNEEAKQELEAVEQLIQRSEANITAKDNPAVKAGRKPRG